jgi:HD-GYP domain-containing protein (c-di-GMP phosphodiesterase class II)
MDALQPVRLADLLSSLSLAIDLGLGLPMEWMQRSAVVAARLAAAAGLSLEDRRAAYYIAMLRMVGCTTTATADAHVLGDELAASDMIVMDHADGRAMMAATGKLLATQGPVQRAVTMGRMIAFSASGQMARNHRMHCEAAAIIAGRVGLDARVSDGLRFVYERWDGKGTPDGVSGDAISLPTRVVAVASIGAHYGRGGMEAARAEVRKRAGSELDPRLASIFAETAGELLAGAEEGTAGVLAAEPGEAVLLADDAMDRALGAAADFGDFKTPHMVGHSRRVAALAEAAGRAASMPATDVALVRRAALVHDVGRVGVQAAIWIKRGPLTESERERVRMHTYLTERVFSNSAALRPLGLLGALHHERLDASGYHRGLGAPMIPAAARLLAAANAWCALTEPRPHRPTMTETEAASALNAQAKAGALDARAVDAVLTAAGQKPLQSRRAAAIALSEREIEVLRLVAGQQSNKGIARKLGISPKTVERHVTHIYDKLGVTTRAGIALYATENGLI